MNTTTIQPAKRVRITLEFDIDDESETPEETLRAFLAGDFDVHDLRELGGLTNFHASVEPVEPPPTNTGERISFSSAGATRR
jgi:hypothetical protein